MKKIILFILSALYFVPSYGQTCKAFIFTKGQKLMYDLRSYPLSFESDMSMITGNTKYKVKNSIVFNEKINSGKIQPKKISQLTSRLINVSETNGKTEYDILAEGMATPIPIKNYCGKDSLITVLYGGRLPYAAKGDTTGLFIFGASFYPAEPKVGSRIKGSVNISLISDNTEIEKFRKLFTTSYNPVNTSAADFYETVTNLTGPVKATLYGMTINQPALVLREEKTVVAGKEYTAYVLGTETWIKSISGKPEKSFYEMEAEYLQTPDMSKKILTTPSFEPGGKRVWEKKSDEITDINKYGCSMSYKEEWYVTGLGVIKTINYDASGAILAVSELKSIE